MGFSGGLKANVYIDFKDIFSMKVGIFVHGIHRSAELIGESFQEQGIEVQTFQDCLCKNKSLDVMPEFVMCHPGDDERCWDILKGIIPKHPSSEYYIFAVGRPNRRIGIGEYANVKYIAGISTGLTALGARDEIVRKIKGDV